MPDLTLYEEDRTYVIDKFHDGHFDYIEVIQEVVQRDFFRYVAKAGLLQRLADSYPTPRTKPEVPTWFYLAADMAMRLHGNHAFNGFPWVVSTGGLLAAFGPSLGTRHVDPETGQLRVECPGFNKKNDYPRSTPCHPDYLRKIAGDTASSRLLDWYNLDVQRIYRQRRFFDKGGLFIGDGSYLFVPDNPNYEGSVVMLFDEHNHPVSKEALARMTPAQAVRVSRRRCYKLVSLLHTDETGNFFLYAGIAVVPGNDHEAPVFWQMVDEFVARVGKGVIRHLILDRGFIDGERIGRAKQAYGIDTTIGVRSNMDAYRDAVGLATLPETIWEQHPRRTRPAEPPVKRHLIDASRAEPLRRREAKRQQTLARRRQEQGLPEPLPPSQWIAKINRTTSFSSCPVPLDVVLCTPEKNPAGEDAWAIMTTAEDATAAAVVNRYERRVDIEERHRHIKCFWDITDFKSPDINLLVNQVVFTLLTYTLLQQHLLQQGKKAFNKATQSRLREKLVPVAEHITVFTDQRYARFSTYEYTVMVMAVPERSRAKLAVRLDQRRREFHGRLAQAPPG
jgi:hypothetical protein